MWPPPEVVNEGLGLGSPILKMKNSCHSGGDEVSHPGRGGRSTQCQGGGFKYFWNFHPENWGR